MNLINPININAAIANIYSLFSIILTGVSMRAADIHPDRTLSEDDIEIHFLVTGHSISMLVRSFLLPIPPRGLFPGVAQPH